MVISFQNIDSWLHSAQAEPDRNSLGVQQNEVNSRFVDQLNSSIDHQRNETPILDFTDCPPAVPSYNSSDSDSENDDVQTVVNKSQSRVLGSSGSTDDESSKDSFGGDIDLDMIENN